MPLLHVFPLDNLVLSTGLILRIGHCKEIRKLTFRELALLGANLHQIILLYFPPTQHTVSLETYPFYSCLSTSIFRFCRNKKRHSNKWYQAPFGPNDSLWAKSKKEAGKKSGAGAETLSPLGSSPHFVRDVAQGTRTLKLSSGEIISMPNVVRNMVAARIIKQYVSYCK